MIFIDLISIKPRKVEFSLQILLVFHIFLGYLYFDLFAIINLF